MGDVAVDFHELDLGDDGKQGKERIADDLHILGLGLALSFLLEFPHNNVTDHSIYPFGFDCDDGIVSFFCIPVKSAPISARRKFCCAWEQKQIFCVLSIEIIRR